MNEYRIALKTPSGVLLTPSLPFSRLEWARAERKVGWLTLDIPGGMVDLAWLAKDARLEIWRSIDGGAAYLEGGCQWLIRFVQTSGNAQNIHIEAADPNYLLDGATIDYDASTPEIANAYSDKTDYADDMLKAFVYENIGAGATDTARRNAYVSVAADHSLAPSTTKQASRRNLLAVLQEVANDSANNGTYLTWDWITVGNNITFETYINQLGHERDYPVSVERGNLLDPVLTTDWRDELTAVKVGGKGEGSARAIGTATSAHVSDTPFSRREAFKSGYNTDDTDTLNAEASAVIYEARPRKVLSGTYADTPGMTYGVHVFYGDIVPAEYAGASIQCRIDSINGLVEGEKETLTIGLRGEADA